MIKNLYIFRTRADRISDNFYGVFFSVCCMYALRLFYLDKSCFKLKLFRTENSNIISNVLIKKSSVCVVNKNIELIYVDILIDDSKNSNSTFKK